MFITKNGKRVWVDHHSKEFEHPPNTDDGKKIIPQKRQDPILKRDPLNKRPDLMNEITRLHKIENEAREQGKESIMYKGMKIHLR